MQTSYIPGENELLFKANALRNLVEPLKDLEGLQQDTLECVANIDKILANHSPTLTDEIAKAHKMIDEEIRRAAKIRLARMNTLLKKMQSQPIIVKPDWMKKYIELLQEQIDALRGLKQYAKDDIWDRVSDSQNKTDEFMIFATCMDKAGRMLSDLDERLEKLYKDMPNAYNEKMLEIIQERVQGIEGIKQRIKEIKQNENIAEIELELMQLIKHEGAHIEAAEELARQEIARAAAEELRKKQSAINEAESRLGAAENRLDALLAHAHPLIHESRKAIIQYIRTTLEEVKKEISMMKSNEPEKSLGALLESIELSMELGEDGIARLEELITRGAIKNPENMNKAEADIEYIEQKPMPGVFEYLGAFLNILAELIVRTFSKIKEMLSEITRPSIERS